MYGAKTWIEGMGSLPGTGTLKSLIMSGIKGTFNKLQTGSYITGIVGEELVA